MKKEFFDLDLKDLREKIVDVRIDSVASATSRARKSFLIMTIFCASITIALWNGYLSWVRDIALPENTSSIDTRNNTDCSCNSRTLGNFIAKVKTKRNKYINSNILNTNANQSGSAENTNTSNSAGNVQRNTAKTNRESLVRDWVSSQTISINLLGIRLTTFDLAVLGSISLVIVMIWHFFVVRRENRAIVPFLKDTYDESKKVKVYSDLNEINANPKDSENVIIENTYLANLVFLGIANNTIFINIAENDNPSKFVADKNGETHLTFDRQIKSSLFSVVLAVFIALEAFAVWIAYWLLCFYILLLFLTILITLTCLIFLIRNREKVEKNGKRKGVINELQCWWKKNKDEAFVFRWLLDLMLFLPSITIFLIILSDIASLFDYSAFREPDMFLIEAICKHQPDVFYKILFFELVAFISFLLTTYLSVRCIQFTKASAESLNIFYRMLIKK